MSSVGGRHAHDVGGGGEVDVHAARVSAVSLGSRGEPHK